MTTKQKKGRHGDAELLRSMNIERKSNKEDIASITLARSHVT
jgi:hypothetical protein